MSWNSARQLVTTRNSRIYYAVQSCKNVRERIMPSDNEIISDSWHLIYSLKRV